MDLFEGLLFDACVLSVYTLHAVEDLDSHNTMTIPKIKLAAASTLSKEATLILLSASQPQLRSK